MHQRLPLRRALHRPELQGPATINQIHDPERILYPQRRKGPRGSGEWDRVSWDHVLDTFAERMHDAFAAGRPNDVMYFVGRPGEDGFADRFLETWGCDGHNSHTNVCSSGGRAGYGLWMGTDRPSPDYANAKFTLLISAHLESGHYFNPHAQRIIEGKHRGSKVAVVDPRLSNTASMSDYWLPTWPGTEAALLLAIAKVLLDEDLIDREFVRRWVNWRTYLQHRAPAAEATFANFLVELRREYERYTPEFAEIETGVPAHTIAQVAREIAAAAPAFSSHIWRAAAAGNLHGWQITRALWMLNVLTGSVGTEGGVSANAWNKFIPAPWRKPTPNLQWNELNWPREYPLAHNEMSILYPHFLLDGDRGSQPVLFTRVLNPVWTYPDGYAWIRALRDEHAVSLYGAMTPTWSETAWWADYVLPMGHGPERHDTHSYETHAGRWLGFRQPVQRVAMQRAGREVEFTHEANPGEVWEEGEFWIEVSWRADPDGSLGIRRYYESPYRPGAKIRLEEYYRWMFENSVPGLPEKAAAEGLDPLGYMRKYGAVEISRDDYAGHEEPVDDPGDREVSGVEQTLTTRTFDPGHLPLTGRPDTIAAVQDGVPRRGFNTPTRKLELLQPELVEWGWPEMATPHYLRSHVHHSLIDHERGQYVLLPTYRLPTLIHSRSGNERWSSALVDMSEEPESGTFRQIHGVSPWESEDPSSSRVWWSDAGVHQNITFPVHPDPISGMHCWHQKVRVRPAEPDDRYADIHVDFAKARAVYHKWIALARPATGDLRRPIWLFRPVKPVLDAYTLPDDERTQAARRHRDAGDVPSAHDFADLVDWDPDAVWGSIAAKADACS